MKSDNLRWGPKFANPLPLFHEAEVSKKFAHSTGDAGQILKFSHENGQKQRFLPKMAFLRRYIQNSAADGKMPMRAIEDIMTVSNHDKNGLST